MLLIFYLIYENNHYKKTYQLKETIIKDLKNYMNSINLLLLIFLIIPFLLFLLIFFLC
jgi:hypothetical protein